MVAQITNNMKNKNKEEPLPEASPNHQALKIAREGINIIYREK